MYFNIFAYISHSNTVFWLNFCVDRFKKMANLFQFHIRSSDSKLILLYFYSIWQQKNLTKKEKILQKLKIKYPEKNTKKSILQNQKSTIYNFKNATFF